MFEGFERARIATSGAEINLVRGGRGPALLLLHGYPQTHVMWHRIAPRLAERFTVVATDLRGYGDSGKPPSDPEHETYSKRATARDQVEVMSAFGHESFLVVGHDRGARVGHRMALDHPGRVAKLAVLDIVPTRTMYRTVSQATATGYYHWFFLIQKEPLPETMIGHDPEFYLRTMIGRWGAKTEAFTPEAVAEYLRCFADPGAIHASCEDYRAGASIDLAHDEADIDHKIGCPLLALWGTRGLVGRSFDVLAVWRERGGDVGGQAIDCGHFLPEEAPEATLAAFERFLDA